MEEQERKRLEEQLWRSQKMEAIGQLAGGIAHDFNNILTIILGYTNLTFDRITADDPVYRNIEGIRKAADRATALTGQLLAFSRRQVLRPRIFRIDTVVTDLHKLVTRLIGENIELLTDLAPDLGLVKADPGQIEQVLMNLVINARDAMPDGGRITIAARNAELTAQDAREYHYVVPGSFVLIEVTDTGEGMDEETLAHIFEPFFTTKEAGKGTGLGLATAYGTVKQSGGYIWAFSEPGCGATFQIFLPRRSELSEEQEPHVQHIKSSEGNEVVLLVEDEDELRSLLRDSMQGKGYRVLEAANGVEALDVARGYDGPIHVAVTGMVMPKMGGRPLAEQLSEARPETLMVFMSGYLNDAAIRRDGLTAKMHFIQKPFEPTALANKIREVLDDPMAR